MKAIPTDVSQVGVALFPFYYNFLANVNTVMKAKFMGLWVRSQNQAAVFSLKESIITPSLESPASKEQCEVHVHMLPDIKFHKEFVPAGQSVNVLFY